MSGFFVGFYLGIGLGYTAMVLAEVGFGRGWGLTWRITALVLRPVQGAPQTALTQRLLPLHPDDCDIVPDQEHRIEPRPQAG